MFSCGSCFLILTKLLLTTLHFEMFFTMFNKNVFFTFLEDIAKKAAETE